MTKSPATMGPTRIKSRCGDERWKGRNDKRGVELLSRLPSTGLFNHNTGFAVDSLYFSHEVDQHKTNGRQPR
jgi:hypothetical protein